MVEKNGTPGELTTGSERMTRTGTDCVIDESGNLLPPETVAAYKKEKVKTVHWKGCRAIPVVKAVGGGVQADWTTLTKEQVKRY